MFQSLRIVLCLSITLSTAVVYADTIELSSGEVLIGKVLGQSEGQIEFEHPLLGRLTIASENVAEVQLGVDATDDETAAEDDAGQAGEDDAAVAAPAEAQAGALDAPAAAIAPSEPSFFDDWDLQLSAGFSGSEGNTRNQSVNAQFSAKKEDERDRWLFDNRYFYGKSGGEVTQTQFTSKLTKDWLNPGSPWFYFAQGEFEYDRFRDWDYRIGGYGGVGYTFVKEEDLEIVARGGLGGSYEAGNGEGFTPEALLGGSLLRWHFAEGHNLTAGVTLYPSLDDLGEFRLNAVAEWTIDIDRANGLKLKFGVEDDYESEVSEGTKRNDFKYYGALVFDF